MPLPLVPVAGAALKYGGVALAAWMVARSVAPARIDQRAEDALDDMPEGLALRRPRDREQGNATGRLVRRVKLPWMDRPVDIDVAFYARFRARKT
ncbi:MAG: hypothetical protein HLUCCA12_05800 [Rhodobacteraceae bacterium HLUCCA12]|nr:MAG: hypothetical protein HLUCCA12_05800 [Rhodobacteraceae bacterium HLUCCA12]